MCYSKIRVWVYIPTYSTVVILVLERLYSNSVVQVCVCVCVGSSGPMGYTCSSLLECSCKQRSAIFGHICVIAFLSFSQCRMQALLPSLKSVGSCTRREERERAGSCATLYCSLEAFGTSKKIQ